MITFENDSDKTPQWYYEAGHSMQMKANYLKLGIYNLNCLLEDPAKAFPWEARKDMKREIAQLKNAVQVIEEAFKVRYNDLSASYTEQQAFMRGFQGL